MIKPYFSCQEQLVPGNTYAEKFEFLARTGFSGIEIWSQNLTGNTEELLNLAKSTGVKVSSGCQGFDGGLINADEDGRYLAISSTKEALAALGEVNAGGFVVPAGFALGSKVLPPFKPPRPADEDFQALCDSLEQVLPIAKKHQVAIFLEPINRYEIHYLNTLSEAEDIVSKINHPQLRIVADFFHMNMEEPNLIEGLIRAGRYLRHVHLADSNRKLPGQGHLNFVSLFKTLQRMKFQGWLAIECDRPSDAKQELPVAMKFLQECWLMAAEE
jgi:sugar phosphate isomerase/epimerase